MCGIITSGLGGALITQGYGWYPFKVTIGKREVVFKVDFKKLEKLKKLLELFLLLLVSCALDEEIPELKEIEIVKRAIELIDLIEKERATVEDLRKQLDLLQGQGEKNE